MTNFLYRVIKRFGSEKTKSNLQSWRKKGFSRKQCLELFFM